MLTQYYRCPIDEHGDVIVAVLSAAHFKGMLVSRARNNPDALVLKLCQHANPINGKSPIPIASVDVSEIPEAKRLTYRGSLIEAGYPWGGSFVEQLEEVIVELGFESYQDPFKEGSDSYGIIVGSSDGVSVVSALLDERAEYCEENPDDEDAAWTMEDPIVEACNTHNVAWLDTDWKHFEIDIDDLTVLGLTAERIEPTVIDQPDTLHIDEVLLLGDRNYVTINVLLCVNDANTAA